jgi:4-hydroxy-3-methylbut-2-enyl diphosphate reductase IspH
MALSRWCSVFSLLGVAARASTPNALIEKPLHA